MKIAMAADHAGYELKNDIKGFISEEHEVIDFGTNDDNPVDYPDYARMVAEAVSTGKADRGIVVCGSGQGAVIAANKVKGVRAGCCADTYSAHQGVEHDDMNVLCLGARVVGAEVAYELARAFISAHFSGEERHQRRLEKVLAIEEDYLK